MKSAPIDPWLKPSSAGTDRPPNPRVSRTELERRWGLLRRAMEDRDIDVLLAQGNSGYFGGYVRYITDIASQKGVATTVIFPRDGGSSVLTHGPDADIAVTPSDDGHWRGVARVLTTPNFPGIGYTERDEQANVAKALQPYAAGTIGLLGLQLISASTLEAIRTADPKARLVDASDVVDPIRAIKSLEEQDLIRATAAMQDAAMLQIFEEIKPGLKERDLAIRAQEIAMSHGSDHGVYMCSSAPRGKPALPRSFREEHRIVAEGDTVHVMLETNGAGGFFTHIVRTLVLGSAPERLVEEQALAVEAQARTVDRLVPGAIPSELWEMHNQFMRANGRPEEKRIYCHSQGYDMMERPVVREAETIPIQAGMNIGCHPSYAYEDVFVWLCNNYLIHEDGAELLHKVSPEVVER